MKKNFISGIVTLVPIYLTVKVVNKVLDWITLPFIKIFFSNNEEYVGILSNVFLLKFMTLIVIVLIVTIIGFISSILLNQTSKYWLNKLFGRLPLVSKTFFFLKDIFHAVVTDLDKGENSSFLYKTVLVKSISSSIATGICSGKPLTLKDGSKLTGVFVPYSPYPIQGLFIHTKEKDIVKELDSFY